MPAFIRPEDSAMRSRRLTLQFADTEVDLVPLIDCVFLLLLFFMLCGHISVNNRAEQITVPPAKTAQPILPPQQDRLARATPRAEARIAFGDLGLQCNGQRPTARS